MMLRRHPYSKLCTMMLLFCMAVLVGLAASCSQDPETDQIEIELWTLSLRPTFTDYMEYVIADFEAAHPGVKVRWVDVPFNAVNRKLIAAAVAGRAPDIVNFSDLQYARFASLGATRDLTDLLDFDPDSVYLEGTLASARIDGQLGALPWYLSTPIQFINTALLDEAGWDAQTIAGDWQTLQAQGREYYEQTGQFLFTQPLAVESELPNMLLADGKPPFIERDGKLRADLTRDEVVAYIDSWVQLYHDGALPRAAATSGHAHVVQMYQDGQVAVGVTGANFLSRVADASPDVFEHTIVRPTVCGSLGRAQIAVMFLSVTSTSKHPKEAADLAAWLTNPENQLAFCKRVNIMPSTPAVLSDPHFSAPSGDPNSPEYKIALARFYSAHSMPEAVAFTPSIGAWPDLRRAFSEGIKAAFLNGEDTRAVLARIEAEWNQILDDNLPASIDAVPRPNPVEQQTDGSGTEGTS